MPFASNNGINIHFELEGEGPALVLQHGATHDITSWYLHGFVEKLKDAYQLILLDARGHGESDKPHQPENYGIEVMADDVVTVLDHLGIAQVHYWGYSMGGFVGYQLAKTHAHRLSTVIVGGAEPYIEPGSDVTNKMIARFERGIEQGIDALIAERRASGAEVTANQEARLRKLDLRSMVAMLRTELKGLDYRSDLPKMMLPCLIYFGSADEPGYSIMTEHIGKLPNATFFALAGLDHSQVYSASDHLVPQVKQFLAQFQV